MNSIKFWSVGLTVAALAGALVVVLVITDELIDVFAWAKGCR